MGVGADCGVQVGIGLGGPVGGVLNDWSVKLLHHAYYPSLTLLHKAWVAMGLPATDALSSHLIFPDIV